MVKYMEKNLDKTKPCYIANKSVGLLILSLKLNSWGSCKNDYYMAESVFAMRLVNLRSVTCYKDQNF